MITPDRFARYPLPIVKLAEHFLKVNCFKGAKAVKDFLPFAEVNQPLTVRLNKLAVNAYVDLFILLESYPETSNQDEDKSLTFFFSKLEFSKQCYLIWSLDAQEQKRLKGIESCKKMFQEMVQILKPALDESPEFIAYGRKEKESETDNDDVYIVEEDAKEDGKDHPKEIVEIDVEEDAEEDAGEDAEVVDEEYSEGDEEEVVDGEQDYESDVDSNGPYNQGLPHQMALGETVFSRGTVSRLNPLDRSFSWKMPNTMLPNHPDVEFFLHSNRTEMTYTNFSCIADARDFLTKEIQYLETTKEGLCCRGVTQGRGETARCFLYKHFVNVRIAESSSDEEVVILPPVKRPKPEVIDLD